MTPLETLENHFWTLFSLIPASLFIQLSGVSHTTYEALERYKADTTARRPMSRKRLVELRSKLLDNLEKHESKTTSGILY